jgi:uncharacterized protein
MKKHKILLILLIFVCFFTFSSAICYGQTHLKLLAIEKVGNVMQGDSADLYVRIIPGQGNVYSATYPLTKIDTQISARFARTVVCNELNGQCDGHDFLYTIKADSAIIGGPSAGAAFATATMAELTGQELDEKISISGTINSGGLIGPVGGLKEKIEAAKNAELTTVLIAKGSRYIDNKNITMLFRNLTGLEIETNTTIIDGNFLNITVNDTLDLVEYGKLLNISVIEVGTLKEAMGHFTHKPFEKPDSKIEIDPSYNETMKRISMTLCNRSQELKTKVIQEYRTIDRESKKIFQKAENDTFKAQNAIDSGNYYSAASFCFSANILFRDLLYEKYLTPTNFIDEAKEISKVKIKEKDFSTLRNLQTYIIVKERLNDRNKLIDDARKIFNSYLKDEANFTAAVYKLAFARERLYSALAWSTFFEVGTQDSEFTEENLRSSCSEKLQEAQERMQYVELFFPISVKATKKDLDQAILDNKNQDYELCLFRSSKVKAESNAILSMMHVNKEQLKILVQEKLNVAKEVIAKQKSFPIVAYSYYQYADSLLESDPASALMYSEYALELANLDIYFKQETVRPPTRKIIAKDPIIAFVLGIIVGAGVILFLIKSKKKPVRKTKIRKRKSTMKKARKKSKRRKR